MAGLAHEMARRLRRERDRLALPAEALANLAGMPLERLAQIEAGDDDADALELAALAGAGVDITFVLTGQPVLAQQETELIDDYRAASDSDRTSAAPTGNASAESAVIPALIRLMIPMRP